MFFCGVCMFSVLIDVTGVKDLNPTCHFVFQIYTGCYDGSVQAVKLNLLQNYRCWVREGIELRGEWRFCSDDVRVTHTPCVVDGVRFGVFRPL